MKCILSFAISVLLTAVILSVLPVYGESGIYNDVLRLHVIAASDSDEDQRQKLLVRDAVLDCVSSAVEDCASFDEAYAAVDGMKDRIREAAQNCLDENVSDSAVTVALGKERYPRRDYGNAILPAGVYPSLRVIIGEGEGKNWWCVLFPTVCVRFAQAGRAADEEAYVAAGFTPEEYRIITGSEGKLQIRFRILEIFSQIFGSEKQAKK